MIRAGDLNRRIRFQRRTAAQDDLGQPAEAWEDVGNPTWASILVVTGKEYVLASGEVSRAEASIRVRWRTDLTAQMRIDHSGVIYNILAVLPDLAGREYVDLPCSTGANNG